jgi:ABC-type antimicrobial peptide transport system permease subunit
VDETFARRNWPDGRAVGQSVYNGPAKELEGQSFRIIGVVGAVKQMELTEQQTDGVIYFPLRDHPLDAESLCVIVRTGLRVEAMGPALQKAVREIEPELPLLDVRPMQNVIDDTLIMRRAPLMLAVIFASVALLLAAIGTYGVISFAVAQRRREIGVRMALGALPGRIGRQFLSMGLRLLLVGIALGVLGAWVSGRAMQSILFHVPAHHPATFAGAAILLGSIALLASLIPAWRASRAEPMEALRGE